MTATLVEEKEKKKIGTHGAQFHLDDAFSCFVLRQTVEFRDAEIIRSVDADALFSTCDVIVDIGGEYDDSRRRYDHHQRGFSETFGPRTPKIKLAASGLCWRHFGREVVRTLWPKSDKLAPPTDADIEVVYQRTYDAFVAPIDAGDNGISMYPPEALNPDVEPLYRDGTCLFSRVKALNGRWNEKISEAEKLERFERASAMAGEELRDCIEHLALSWLPARQIVERAFAARLTVHPSGHVIAFGKGEACPYVSHLRDLEEEQHTKKVLFAIVWDDARQQWACTAVAVRPDSFECRLAFPAEWRGLRDQELCQKTGIPNSVFVHASGFLACNKTMEGIMAMISRSMEMQPQGLAKWS